MPITCRTHWQILFTFSVPLHLHSCPSSCWMRCIITELKRKRPIQLLQPSVRLNRGLFSLNGLVAHLRTLLPKDFDQLEKPLGVWSDQSCVMFVPDFTLSSLFLQCDDDITSICTHRIPISFIETSLVSVIISQLSVFSRRSPVCSG